MEEKEGGGGVQLGSLKFNKSQSRIPGGCFFAISRAQVCNMISNWLLTELCVRVRFVQDCLDFYPDEDAHLKVFLSFYYKG